MIETELAKILVGQSDVHVVPWRESGRFVHREMLTDLERLVQAAASEGLGLEISSAFRGFERQLAIWNAKATGQRPLLDVKGMTLDFAQLTDNQIVQAILRWSALPGTSRHHWGTDIDVYDRLAVARDYQVQLTLEECRTQFAHLHRWLDLNMQSFGFYRPYAEDLGGIAPEPWHLSYAPLSQTYFRSYSYSALESLIQGSALVLKERVLENLPQIYERYFLRISPVPPLSSQKS